MESSSEGILVRELTRLSTRNDGTHKRSSSPLLYEESKRPRLEDDMETSSRESRWSRYRDCTTLSTLTEASDSHENADDVLDGYNVHVAAHQVLDLEHHIDKLAMELEAWSLVNLKEWRQMKAIKDSMDIDAGSPVKPNPKKITLQRQKAAKRNLMRALRYHETESIQDG